MEQAHSTQLLEWSTSLQRTNKAFRSAELEKEFAYLFEKPTNKNKSELQCPSIKMVFPIVFKLLEISTHECFAAQIVIRVQSLLMFSYTCPLNLMNV